MNPLVILLIAMVALLLLFSVTYLAARLIDNYGIVDVIWAYAFAGVAWFYAAQGSGWPLRAILIAALATGWSLRLGSHLAQRVASHHPTEDSRYRQLRQDWAANFGQKMFGFFQLQAVSVALLSLPFFWPTRHPGPGLNAFEIAGVAICLLAIAGESLADRQLRAFVRRAENRGRVCDVGMWAWSRHPNYFCEWCIWVGFFVFACGSPWGWTSVFAPAVILHLLLNVTGVPLAEASSLRSKGDAYRDYQRRTAAYFPTPPRRD